jgi:ATP-dependent DNA helicase RecG
VSQLARASGQSTRDWTSRSVATLRGVGARIAARLERVGVLTLGDVLCWLPLRYEDRTQLTPIGSAKPGQRPLMQGRVELAEVATRRRRSLLCRISDGTGSITLRFFHFSAAQHEQLARGSLIRCFGEIRVGPTGLELVHPEYRLITDPEEAIDEALTPIYPSTEGLHQQKIRQLVSQALDLLEREPLDDVLGDLLPDTWPSLSAALEYLHRPPTGGEASALTTGASLWQRRLALEELIAQRVSVKSSAALRMERATSPLSDNRGRLLALTNSLPFSLTAAQQRSIAEIASDLGKPRPMLRLLQGDVGSGKTVVAAAAAVIAAASDRQTAVMAPTELLAEQHYANFAAWLKPLGIEVGYLSGSVAGRARQALVAKVAEGSIDVLIGTHALIRGGVVFASLGLTVVDEQHRFGVNQRLDLQQKGQGDEGLPHQLIMTATPIPRTLAMTVYADLECSVIDELPPGRKPVRTIAIPERRREELVRKVSRHCQADGQAYWVCPLIDESETIESSAAAELAQALTEALPDVAIGLVHGRMRQADKDHVMRCFKDGSIKLLVATTVVEVGVDVPNASLMIIENAERMGLAQLHQLRGRVGRGTDASTCVLVYKPPLTDVARKRLTVMRETTDGFEIARNDLKLRGPGELLGTKQTGTARYKVADLSRDTDLLPDVLRISDTLLSEHPERIQPLVQRWVRGAEEFAGV